jgi:dihydroorotate dehydrogenase
LGFGFLELGTVTYLPQEENPAPNLFRLPRDHALINRLGFPNEGAQIVADRLRTLRDQHPLSIPIGLSIGKSRHVPVADTAQVTEDTLACFRAVRTAADFVVVNVSSPNTPGLRSLQAPACAQPLLSALVEENLRGKPLPLFLKLAPDLHSYALDALLTVLSQLPLAGVVATNTTVARRGLITPPAVVKALGEGGLSGPPLRPRALEVVAHTRKRLGPKAIILGVGGIETPADAEAFLIAGADLVQVYTGFVYEGPGLPRTLAKGLIERMEYHHAKDFAHYLEILRAASPG